MFSMLSARIFVVSEEIMFLEGVISATDVVVACCEPFSCNLSGEDADISAGHRNADKIKVEIHLIIKL